MENEQTIHETLLRFPHPDFVHCILCVPEVFFVAAAGNHPRNLPQVITNRPRGSREMDQMTG